MTPYATYAQFTAVYSLAGVPQAQVESYWLVMGTAWVNEQLGRYYTVPFSTNNLTARDLCIQHAAFRVRQRTLKAEDSEELGAELRRRVKGLAAGDPMMLDDDTLLYPSGGGTAAVWSNTMEHKPTFDLREPEAQRVDPDRLDELEDDDA